MRTETVRFAKKVVPHLYPDELLLVAAKVANRGREDGTAPVERHGARWWTYADAIAGTLPTTKPVLWVLTDHRVLFFEIHHLRSSEPILAISRKHITVVAATPAKKVFAKVELGFDDRSSIALDLRTDRELAAINDAARILLRPAA